MANQGKRKAAQAAIDDEPGNDEKRRKLNETVDITNRGKEDRIAAKARGDTGHHRPNQSEPTFSHPNPPSSPPSRVIPIFRAWKAEEAAIQQLVNVSDEFKKANFDTYWNPCLARLQHGANCNIKSIELRIRKAREILALKDKSREDKYEQHCLVRLILEDRFIVSWDLERKVEAMTLGNDWQTRLGLLDSVGQEVDRLYEKEKWSETELLEEERRRGLPCGEHARRRRALD